MAKGKHILIAGLGNELLSDDGAGIHALRALREAPPSGARLAEIGTAVLDALALLEWADTVVAVDAVRAGGEAGTIYRMSGGDVDDSGTPASMHELNLIQALQMISADSRPKVVVLGVEPAVIGYGLELSPPVGAALPGLVRAIRQTVADLSSRSPVS